VGRPARISRAQIAEAANELGLSDLTLRAVADRLGVSIASLYHHVDSKDDLLRLAAEQSVAGTPLPEDRGQDWRTWLHEWAAYNRSVFVGDPAMLGQYLEGAIAPDVVAESTELIITVLVREGFTAREALDAYQLVASCALGAALRELREAGAGRDAFADALVDRDPESFPHLRAMLDETAERPMSTFEERIDIVLDGLAAGRER